MLLNGIEKIFFTHNFGRENMKHKNDIFYSLNIKDIQTVAIQEINRELTVNEIDIIKNLICEKINWYDAIVDSIYEKIDSTNSG